MKNLQIKSVFERIAPQIFAETDINKAKALALTFINETKVNVEDKAKITKDITECKSMYAFQRYICNSLLKYEGLSINKKNK